MLTALKNIFAELSGDHPAVSAESEQRRLHLAVAGLLHEMMRIDANLKPEEAHTAVAGLVEMCALSPVDAKALLVEAGSQRLTSYFDPASTIMRMLARQRAKTP